VGVGVGVGGGGGVGVGGVGVGVLRALLVWASWLSRAVVCTSSRPRTFSLG
jgi:hypothetical protein